VQPSRPAPLPTLEGNYFAGHKVYVYDPITGDDVPGGEDTDVLTIEKAPNDALRVKILVVAYCTSAKHFGQQGAFVKRRFMVLA
jgi:hypothetical protein